MTGGAILSVEQVRKAEQAVFDTGTDPYALMCRAGAGAAEIIWRAGVKRDALVLCGPGNNGGDGYVVARWLRDHDVPVRVAALTDPRTESARKARNDWGGPVEDIMSAEPASQIVDALFGIGLARGLDDSLACRLRELVETAGHSYALDVPSGVESDQAVALSSVPMFSHCIALGAWKPAHMLMPSRQFAAQHVLVDIGLVPPEGAAFALAMPNVSPPSRDAQKYSRGLVVVIAGEMPGAAILSAEAAARAGAGYVRLLTDDRSSHSSHAIVRSHTDDFSRAKSLLVGPGLGRNPESWDRLAESMSAGIPVVADADALWLLADKGMGDLPHPMIATPHEGEFNHLFGDEEGNKIERTRSASRRTGMVIVHKGSDTVIAAPDGRSAVSLPASSWLSTAGTGDVLAGLCASRLAVGVDPFRAACEAVWIHGEAARRAGVAFVADDLVAHISAAMAAAA